MIDREEAIAAADAVLYRRALLDEEDTAERRENLRAAEERLNRALGDRRRRA